MFQRCCGPPIWVAGRSIGMLLSVVYLIVMAVNISSLVNTPGDSVDLSKFNYTSPQDCSQQGARSVKVLTVVVTASGSIIYVRALASLFNNSLTLAGRPSAPMPRTPSSRSSRGSSSALTSATKRSTSPSPSAATATTRRALETRMRDWRLRAGLPAWPWDSLFALNLLFAYPRNFQNITPEKCSTFPEHSCLQDLLLSCNRLAKTQDTYATKRAPCVYKETPHSSATLQKAPVDSICFIYSA
mmetsp:Transcript_58502/g.154291  ORF Transcript_58502/g.154291 Transcript_58502/m.154291 type:complete len:243 (+) Transcript_58502:307-1035(+)